MKRGMPVARGTEAMDEGHRAGARVWLRAGALQAQANSKVMTAGLTTRPRETMVQEFEMRLDTAAAADDLVDDRPGIGRSGRRYFHSELRTDRIFGFRSFSARITWHVSQSLGMRWRSSLRILRLWQRKHPGDWWWPI